MKKQDAWYQKRTGLLAGLQVLAVLGILRLITGFNGLYGQDAYEYLAYTTDLRAWMMGGPRPPEFFWPEMYPFFGALFSFIFGDVATALQFLSMLSLAMTAALLTRLAPRTTNLPGGGFTTVTVIFVGLSPFLVRNGMMIMADAFATACVTGALLNWYVYQTRHTSRHLAGALIMSSLAVLTRYPAGIIVGFFFVHSLYVGIRDRRWGALAIGLAVAALPVLVHLGLQGPALPDHHFLDGWSPNHWFRRHFTMLDGSFSYTLPNIVFYLGAFYHPGFLGAAVLVLPRLIFRLRDLSRFHRLLLIPLMAYLLFLAGIPFQNQRFILLVIPLVFFLYIHDLLFAFHLFHTKLGVYYAVLAGLVVLNLALVYRTGHKFWDMSARETQMGTAVKDQVPGKIYTFGIEGALKYHAKGKEVVSMYENDLPGVGPGDAVLFNEPAYQYQWAGKNPMIHWNALQSKHSLSRKQSFGEGWVLYEIR